MTTTASVTVCVYWYLADWVPALQGSWLVSGARPLVVAWLGRVATCPDRSRCTTTDNGTERVAPHRLCPAPQELPWKAASQRGRWVSCGLTGLTSTERPQATISMMRNPFPRQCRGWTGLMCYGCAMRPLNQTPGYRLRLLLQPSQTKTGWHAVCRLSTGLECLPFLPKGRRANGVKCPHRVDARNAMPSLQGCPKEPRATSWQSAKLRRRAEATMQQHPGNAMRDFPSAV